MAGCIVDPARAASLGRKLALSHDWLLVQQNGGMITLPKDCSADSAPLPRRFFVSRHPGAIEWARQYPWAVRARFVPHLEIEEIGEGDVLIGTLPVHLAAEVCARGARYLHLSISLTAGQRGCELTAQELDAADACLVPYEVIAA